MKVFITCLLFLKLLGISAYVSFAQQGQSYQKLVQEVEVLKTQVSALQIQLQTVKNVEKIELMAKLADARAKLTDANAKLMNAEFGNFERKLRNSNDDWLIKMDYHFSNVYICCRNRYSNSYMEPLQIHSGFIDSWRSWKAC